MKKLIFVAVVVLSVTTHSRLLVTDISGEEKIYARNTPQGTRYYPHFRSEKQMSILREDSKIFYLYRGNANRRAEYNIRQTRSGARLFEGRTRSNVLYNARETRGTLRIYAGGSPAQHLYTLRNNGDTWLIYKGQTVLNPVGKIIRQQGIHTSLHLLSAMVQAGYLTV